MVQKIQKNSPEITIGTLAELSIKNGYPFLGYAEKLQPFEFMQEYLKDFELFDEDIMETRGFFIPITVKETKEETLEHFRKRAGFVIKKHSKELESLWKIANTTFDPAYNVEEHIVEDIKKTGSDTLRDAIDSITQTDSLGARKNTSLYGEQQQTQNIGSQTSSVQYGEQSQTQNIGAQTSSAQYGEQTQTQNIGSQTSSVQYGEQTQTQNTGAQTSSVEYGEQSQSQITGAQSSSVEYGAKQSAGEEEKAAFNSLDYQKNISTSNTENAHTDNTNTGARTDSLIKTSHTDTTSNGERTDTNTSSTHTDTTSNGERIDKNTTSSHTDTTSSGERTDSTTLATHTDTTNEGERIDSSTFSAHTDEITTDAVVDTHKTDYREDIHEQTYDNTVSRRYDRQGNVGTMSTPELLQKAADSVKVFDFYNKLYDIVLRELAWYSESGYDVMF